MFQLHLLQYFLGLEGNKQQWPHKLYLQHLAVSTMPTKNNNHINQQNLDSYQKTIYIDMLSLPIYQQNFKTNQM